MRHKISDKKQKEIDKFLSTPIQVGESVTLTKKKEKQDYRYKSSYGFEVIDTNGDTLTLKENQSPKAQPVEVSVSDVENRNLFSLGVNPLAWDFGKTRPVAYSMDSIIYTFELQEKRWDVYDIDGIEISEINWNPYVYDNQGNKIRYQRDFVWTEAQNKNFIQSLYNGVSLGSIVVRKRSFDGLRKMKTNGETELSFVDIVDGKQRLNALRLFINDEISDWDGNFFGDLSFQAQNKLFTSQLISYAEMGEDTTDKEVLSQFLRMNIEGTPQDPKHLGFVDMNLKNLK